MAKVKHFASKSRRRRHSGPSSAAGATSASPGSSSAPRKHARGNAADASESSAARRQQRKPHRYRPGTVALREIRHFQKTWKLVIPAAPFIRTVKEISNFYAPEVTRWTAEALVALQEAAEDYLVHLFEDAMLCTIHAKRVTLSTGFLIQVHAALAAKCEELFLEWVRYNIETGYEITSPLVMS